MYTVLPDWPFETDPTVPTTLYDPNWPVKALSIPCVAMPAALLGAPATVI
jgi:hypothetical protein